MSNQNQWAFLRFYPIEAIKLACKLCLGVVAGLVYYWLLNLLSLVKGSNHIIGHLMVDSSWGMVAGLDHAAQTASAIS